MTGIYRVTSPSGKVYIGQARDIKRRFREHKYEWKSMAQPKFHSSLRKYGYENHVFSVIHELPIDVSQEIINEYEKFYIQQYREVGFNLMNTREGGANGPNPPESIEKQRISRAWYRHSEETKKKISESKKSQNLKGERSWGWGKPRSPETVKKMAESKRGSKHTMETRKKMSEAQKKRNKSN